ncbi:MAG: hypothetical protein P1U86_13280 [Verrucomicrobiales bacterium]|nr:hypothetical protein [Verrucomicrobiales bacterium]
MTFKNCKIIFLGVFLALGSLVANAQNEAEKDWLESYYESPTPDQFVAQMKNWAAEGVLEMDSAKPALIAFTSQLIRQNREKLSDWYSALSGLTPAQMQVIHTAMLYSRTKEADEIMLKQFGTRYEEEKKETQKILELPLDKEATADMLWGFFYATGSEHAIRRIVLCFRFQEAPENPDGVDVPEGYVPHYKELPAFAYHSLVANGKRHPLVVDILEKMLKEDGSLVELEKEGVYNILSAIKPDEYPDRTSAEKA